MIIKQVKDQPLFKIGVFNQLATQSYFVDNDKPTANERVDLVSFWQDIDITEVERMSLTTINAIVNGVIEIVYSYESKAPRDRIGNFTHRTDYLDFSMGHHKHIETVDFTKSPESFMGLFYIEEGLHYGYEVEEGGKTIIKNPLIDRAKAIKEKSNLSELIDLLTFFLNISELLTNRWVTNLVKNHLVQKKKLSKIS